MVHQHHVNTASQIEYDVKRGLPAFFGRNDFHPETFEKAGQRKNIADVIVDNQGRAATQFFSIVAGFFNEFFDRRAAMQCLNHSMRCSGCDGGLRDVKRE